jgi:hypothetical protein
MGAIAYILATTKTSLTIAMTGLNCDSAATVPSRMMLRLATPPDLYKSTHKCAYSELAQAAIQTLAAPGAYR